MVQHSSILDINVALYFMVKSLNYKSIDTETSVVPTKPELICGQEGKMENDKESWKLVINSLLSISSASAFTSMTILWITGWSYVKKSIPSEIQATNIDYVKRFRENAPLERQSRKKVTVQLLWVCRELLL